MGEGHVMQRTMQVVCAGRHPSLTSAMSGARMARDHCLRLAPEYSTGSAVLGFTL